MRKVVLAEPKSGHFDAIVELMPPRRTVDGRVHPRFEWQVSTGMLIPTGRKNIRSIAEASGRPVGQEREGRPKPQHEAGPRSETDSSRDASFEYGRIKKSSGRS